MNSQTILSLLHVIHLPGGEKSPTELLGEPGFLRITVIHVSAL